MDFRASPGCVGGCSTKPRSKSCLSRLTCSPIGQSLEDCTYRERRGRLEALDLAGPAWTTTPVTSDGAMLWEWVCEQGMEGVVSKRVSSRYLPGQRRWLKTKNRDYWRYPLEVGAARRFAKST